MAGSSRRSGVRYMRGVRPFPSHRSGSHPPRSSISGIAAISRQCDALSHKAKRNLNYVHRHIKRGPRARAKRALHVRLSVYSEPSPDNRVSTRKRPMFATAPPPRPCVDEPVSRIDVTAATYLIALVYEPAAQTPAGSFFWPIVACRIHDLRDGAPKPWRNSHAGSLTSRRGPRVRRRRQGHAGERGKRF